MNRKTAFVTGSSGFIGSHLINRLKQKYRMVSLIHDDFSSLWLNEALEGTIKISGNITDIGLIKRIISQYDVTEVFHLAALAKVKTANKDPINVWNTNVMGTVNVLEACRQLDVKKVAVMMTDKVYGEKLNAVESDRLQSSESYGSSKAAAQLAAETYNKTYNMNVLIPHSCNVFGLDLRSDRIVTNTIKNCLSNKQPIIFNNDTSIREYIYIDDLIDALMVLMYDGEGLSYTGNYNINTGWVYNQKDIVMKILENFPDVKPMVKNVNLPNQIQAQTMKSERFIFTPNWTIESAIKKSIELFVKYQNDW